MCACIMYPPSLSGLFTAHEYKMIQCAVVLVNKSQVYTKGVETFIGDISLELLARWHIKQLGIYFMLANGHFDSCTVCLMQVW